MHMADALISPLVGTAGLVAGAAFIGDSSRKLGKIADTDLIPLMGMSGAFVFAAQMINFSIPGTGSSGHIGGGLLLASLLGPEAGFIVMASILLIQAVFFMDGGLLAYGCNLINLGFATSYLAFPLIMYPMMKGAYSRRKTIAASLVSAVVALQIGSFGVVIETIISARVKLGFSTFLMLMQPIHLAIGIVEGLVTAAVIIFIAENEKGILKGLYTQDQTGIKSRKYVLALAITALVAGVLSLFASSNPDGLEWSVEKAGIDLANGAYPMIENLQSRISFWPDYTFKGFSSIGTGISGLLGAFIVLALAIGAGYLIRKRETR